MPEITIDLPYPVSVNAIWRSGRKRVFKSKAYRNWLAAAYGQWLVQRSQCRDRHIQGNYGLQIIFNPPDKRRRDLDNLGKVCNDFAQAARIIDDDRYCRRLLLEYGDASTAPLGARLIFKSM